MKIFCALSGFFLIAVVSATVAAQSQPEAQSGTDKGAATGAGPVQSLRATITGNQEQPKVLYIVPWKAAYENNAVPPKPISGQTDKVFRHLDRHEHQRQVEFLQEFAASNENQ